MAIDSNLLSLHHQISLITYDDMSKTVNQRLEALREVMQRESLDAFIFPSTDPHQGEYVPDHWKGREWISGFGNYKDQYTDQNQNQSG